MNIGVNMNKAIILFSALLLLSFTAATCTINTVLVNQDPYPAMPGDYVKVIFQVSGISGSECSSVKFWFDDFFPFSLDPGSEREVTMKSGTYAKDYKDFFLIPYKLRVDKAALDGENEITVKYTVGGNEAVIEKKFNITVEDSRSDFEVNIKDYSLATKKLTLDILNIGPKNVEALTLELPKQDNANVYGTNKIIIGNLDANQDDIATFDADLKQGGSYSI
ncbi:MAG: hypothetical protein AABW51_01370 [Nanoarchaeota archaeon]